MEKILGILFNQAIGLNRYFFCVYRVLAATAAGRAMREAQAVTIGSRNKTIKIGAGMYSHVGLLSPHLAQCGLRVRKITRAPALRTDTTADDPTCCRRLELKAGTAAVTGIRSILIADGLL